MNKNKTAVRSKLDIMKEYENKEEDAFFPEELLAHKKESERDKYFEFYDDVKTSIKEDW